MINLPFHRKFRPTDFDQIIGNKDLIESLQTALSKEKGITTFLLQGPSGCGKTTLARIIGRHLGAEDRYVKELNISDTRGIDAARNIIRNAQFQPFSGDCNVYILNEVHKSTNEFQNAMLEILGEPPRNTYFILCTTDPNKLLNTVKNRCTTYQVRKLRVSEISKLITHVLTEEKNKKFPKKGIREIAYAADGCPREALKILDSVIDIRDEEKLLSSINDFSIAKKEVIELCRALLNGDKWRKVANILKELDEEPEDIRYAILGYMAAVILNKQNDRAFLVIEEFKESFMYTKKAGLVSACYAICNI